MWLYKFSVSIGKIVFYVDMFVPDSVPESERQSHAEDNFKTFANALAQKAQAVF